MFATHLYHRRQHPKNSPIARRTTTHRYMKLLSNRNSRIKDRNALRTSPGWSSAWLSSFGKSESTVYVCARSIIGERGRERGRECEGKGGGREGKSARERRESIRKKMRGIEKDADDVETKRTRPALRCLETEIGAAITVAHSSSQKGAPAEHVMCLEEPPPSPPQIQPVSFQHRIKKKIEQLSG